MCRHIGTQQRRSGTPAAQLVLVSPDSIAQQLGGIWSVCQSGNQHGGLLLHAVQGHHAAIAQQLGVSLEEVDWCFKLPYCGSRNQPMTIRKLSGDDPANKLTGVFQV